MVYKSKDSGLKFWIGSHSWNMGPSTVKRSCKLGGDCLRSQGCMHIWGWLPISPSSQEASCKLGVATYQSKAKSRPPASLEVISYQSKGVKAACKLEATAYINRNESRPPGSLGPDVQRSQGWLQVWCHCLCSKGLLQAWGWLPIKSKLPVLQAWGDCLSVQRIPGRLQVWGMTSYQSKGVKTSCKLGVTS
jgi:hypothetical protein